MYTVALARQNFTDAVTLAVYGGLPAGNTATLYGQRRDLRPGGAQRGRTAADRGGHLREQPDLRQGRGHQLIAVATDNVTNVGSASATIPVRVAN